MRREEEQNTVREKSAGVCWAVQLCFLPKLIVSIQKGKTWCVDEGVGTCSMNI